MYVRGGAVIFDNMIQKGRLSITLISEHKIEGIQGDSQEDFSGNIVPEKGTNNMQTLSIEEMREESMFMLEEAFRSQKRHKYNYN